MKKPGFCGKFLAAAVVLALAGARLPAQTPDNVNIAIIKLFGNAAAFTAAVDLQVLDKAQKEWARTPMTFSVLDGKIRIDLDVNQMKGDSNTITAFKKLGMDRLANVVRPDKKTIYIIYPRIRSYINVAMSAEDSAASAQNLKVVKTAIGREKAAGHACVKNHVLVKDEKGAVTVDATTWNAGDLKDFPVQIETTEDGYTTFMVFSRISFAKPDASLFDVPTGYASYLSAQALMVARAKAVRAGK